MEKLLHERLREIDESHIGEIKVQGVDIRLFPVEAQILADEIERYYIPRPRFEDGEPVQFGDEFIIKRYMWEPETLTRLTINTKEQLEEWNQYHGVAPVYEMNFVRPNCEDGKEPIIKRPQPKVLDADGVEIKVGDKGYDPSGNELEVLFIEPKLIESLFVRDAYRNEFHFCPRQFTHKEPDSLERIKADRELTVCEYSEKYGGSKSQGKDLLDRAIALIERGA